MGNLDFFISYTRHDTAWAEWIAWQLENAGYSVRLQAWHTRPGDSFVRLMHDDITAANHVLAVISEHYFASDLASSEWRAAFNRDPSGRERRLIPIRISSFHATGLLSDRVYIDLVGLREDEARAALLIGVQRDLREHVDPHSPVDDVVKRAAPTFPGVARLSPSTARKLFIFLGPSGVDKDVIAARVRYRLALKGIHLDSIRKYTTRSPRPGAAMDDSFEFMTMESFDDGVKTQRIVEVQRAYGHVYGIDKNVAAAPDRGMNLVGTLRAQDEFEVVRRLAADVGIRPYSILVLADRRTLEERILHRSGPQDEKMHRLELMLSDLAWLSANKAHLRDYFSLVVDNSDSRPLRVTLTQCLRFIRSKLAARE